MIGNEPVERVSAFTGVAAFPIKVEVVQWVSFLPGVTGE